MNKMSASRLLQALGKSHALLTGDRITRTDSCSFCGSVNGLKIGGVCYWDIAKANVVQCLNCRQMQLDPMLTSDQVSAGCLAYYVHAKKRIGPKWYLRNNQRQFRTGVRFHSYLRSLGIQPEAILELGPGEGYFSRALNVMLPEANITCVDVDRQATLNIERVHGFTTHMCMPEELDSQPQEQFDLIIARDLLEHVIDPAKVLLNCCRLLKKGGYLHILTPNGYEDVWSIHLRWKFLNDSTDLSLNHLNYFDGASLIQYMDSLGLNIVDCHQYDLRGFLKGYGWSFNRKLIGPPPTLMPHEEFSFDEQKSTFTSDRLVLPSKYVLNNPFLRNLWVSYYHIRHLPEFRISMERQTGRYIFCLVQKNQQ